jgi:hypothetical protein
MADARAQQDGLTGAIALDSGQRRHRSVPVAAEHTDGVLCPTQRAVHGLEQVNRVCSAAQGGEQFVELSQAIRGATVQGGADMSDVLADIRDGVSDLLRRPVTASH